MNMNEQNNPTIEQRIERKLQEAEIAGHEVEFYCYEQLQGPVALSNDDFNPEKLWKR